MPHPFWNDWHFGWCWMLWLGFIFLVFSGLGNWGYTYRAHRKYGLKPHKDALDILSERYARGEITRDQYALSKTGIVGTAS